MGTGSEPVIIDDVQAIETSVLRGWQHLPVRSVLEVPTCFQGKINGVISLIRQSLILGASQRKMRFQRGGISSDRYLPSWQTRLIASLQQQVHTEPNTKAIDQLTMVSHSSLDLNQILKLAIVRTVLQVERGLLLMLKYADPLFKTRKSEKPFPKQSHRCL